MSNSWDNTALKSETACCIIQDAKSAIFHSALGDRHKLNTIGFLLGDPYAPVFRFALPVGFLTQPDNYQRETLEPLLRDALIPAAALAKEFKTTVLGLFVAWDTDDFQNKNEQLGCFVDTTRALKLNYLLMLPIDGAESIWAHSLYDTRFFPPNKLDCPLRQRDSDSPLHNHRRVTARWKELTA